MGLQEPGNLLLSDELRDLARRLDAAGHGAKGALIDEFGALYGWTRQRIYRELRKIGWRTGRQRRADAGSTRQDEAALTALAAALRLGVRKNGKATMETPNARALLAANGHRFEVSNGRINQLLRQRQMDLASQRQASPHVNMRSLHPNHVHLVDPSLCLLFYTPDGKQHMIRDDEAYKNKPEFLERVGELKCWRYVLVDHYSNTVMVRYYQSKGETQANLYDFLLHCWRKIDGRPFHGVPKLLVWDKGSANTASAIKHAIHALQSKTYEHKAGNPRAKGGVEEANNRVEKLFESRLLYEPVDSIEALNVAADAWCNAYNADRIPEYDAKLRRPGMARPLARFEIWQRIRKDQLRTLPDIEICRYLLSAEPKSRKVRPNLTITFVHPVAKRSLEYDLRQLAGVYPKQEVMVSPLVMDGSHQVFVQVADYKGDVTEHLVAPVAYEEMGLRLDAPVWGEAFDKMPDTPIQKAGKAADRAAYPSMTQDEIEKAKGRKAKPFGGLDAHSHLGQVYLPSYMDRPGTELEVPNRAQVEIKPLSHIQACRALVGKLGRSLSAEENAWIRATFPDGVPEEELPDLALRLDQSIDAQRPGLAVVK